jgi:hypothetical protein
MSVTAAKVADADRIERLRYFTDGSQARWEHYER